MESKKVKIAALSDIHIKEDSSGLFQEVFASISQNADVLVLGGDLTDHGLPTQAHLLAKEFTFCRIPIVGVLGNHDYESGKQEEVKKILTEGGMKLLEDGPVEIEGIGFAGVKGFGGGFDNHMLGSFGEKTLKDFVQETINEALHLETSLGQLKTKHKVVVMHYSPLVATCIGEPPEIFPFLGSSRLSEPINRFEASVVFHGHAHFGSPEGKTMKKIPVYNVAYPLMQKLSPDKPYKVIEL